MNLPLLFAAARSAADPECAGRLASAAPVIDHANADWARAMREADAPALAEAYAEDGLFILPDGTVVKGRAAVQQLYAARTRAAPGSILGGEIRSEGRVCVEGGLVFEWGQGVLRARGADGQPHVRGGQYLTVWKQVDGQWRIVRNLAF